MATTATAVEPHRETHLPGDLGIWVFVLGDLVIFGTYFVIFMIDRTQNRELFLASQRHLSLTLAVLNTLLLLASSRFVALGVLAAGRDDRRRAMRLVSCAAVCGGLFIAIKAYEWSTEIRHGHTLASNSFFMFYFMLTGVHLLHVVLGLIFLAIVHRELRRTSVRLSVVEVGATYWHLVDLLWVVIFALVYVMR